MFFRELHINLKDDKEKRNEERRLKTRTPLLRFDLRRRTLEVKLFMRRM